MHLSAPTATKANIFTAVAPPTGTKANVFTAVAPSYDSKAKFHSLSAKLLRVKNDNPLAPR